MSADALREALGALDIHATVEARDRLAVLRPADGEGARRIAAHRSHVAALAAEQGFTHVALEIEDA